MIVDSWHSQAKMWARIGKVLTDALKRETNMVDPSNDVLQLLGQQAPQKKLPRLATLACQYLISSAFFSLAHLPVIST